MRFSDKFPLIVSAGVTNGKTQNDWYTDYKSQNSPHFIIMKLVTKIIIKSKINLTYSEEDAFGQTM